MRVVDSKSKVPSTGAANAVTAVSASLSSSTKRNGFTSSARSGVTTNTSSSSSSGGSSSSSRLSFDANSKIGIGSDRVRPSDRSTIASSSLSNNNRTDGSTSTSVVRPSPGFEEEALALQKELADMQRALQDRMQRYNKLSTFNLPN